MAKPQDWAKPEKWGREVPFDHVANPVVFHFRPHSIVAISAENRAEFEKYFEENVGFPPPKMEGRAGSRKRLSERWDQRLERRLGRLHSVTA